MAQGARAKEPWVSVTMVDRFRFCRNRQVPMLCVNAILVDALVGRLFQVEV